MISWRGIVSTLWMGIFLVWADFGAAQDDSKALLEQLESIVQNSEIPADKRKSVLQDVRLEVLRRAISAEVVLDRIESFIQQQEEEIFGYSLDLTRAWIHLFSVCPDPRSTRALIGASSASRFQVREAACEGLGRIGGEGAVEALTVLLRDAVPRVSIAACYALGRLRSEEAAAQIIPLLEGHLDVRIAACRSLAQCGGDRALPSLLEATGDKDSDVRLEALGAALEIVESSTTTSGFRSQSLLAFVAGFLSDASIDVRCGVIRMLVERNHLFAVGDLIEALSAPHDWIRYPSCRMLHALYSQRFGYDPGEAPDSELNRDAVERWKAWWAKKSSHPDRDRMTLLLVGLRSPLGKIRQGVERQITVLGTKSPDLYWAPESGDDLIYGCSVVGIECRRVLARILAVGAPAAGQELFRSWLEDEDQAIREAGLTALLRLGLEEDLLRMAGRLGDPSDEVFHKILKALVQNPSPRSTTLLISAARTLSNPERLLAVIRGLGLRKDPKACAYLESLVPLSDRSRSLALLDAYREIDHPDSVRGGCLLTQHEDPLVRTRSCLWLGRMIQMGWGGDEVTECLQTRLADDEESVVRRAASWSLGWGECRTDVLVSLEKATWDPEVAEAALQSMGRLGGEKALVGLKRVLDRASEENIRVEVFRALGRLESAAADPILMQGLGDRSDQVRRVILEGEISIEQDAQVERIVELVRSDPSLSVRVSATIALARAEGEKAGNLLVQLADEADREEIRLAARCGLYGSGRISTFDAGILEVEQVRLVSFALETLAKRPIKVDWNSLIDRLAKGRYDKELVEGRDPLELRVAWAFLAGAETEMPGGMTDWVGQRSAPCVSLVKLLRGQGGEKELQVVRRGFGYLLDGLQEGDFSTRRALSDFVFQATGKRFEYDPRAGRGERRKAVIRFRRWWHEMSRNLSWSETDKKFVSGTFKDE